MFDTMEWKDAQQNALKDGFKEMNQDMKAKVKEAGISQPVMMGLIFVVVLVIAAAIIIPIVNRTAGDGDSMTNQINSNFDAIQESVDNADNTD